jgi:LPXTG-motif cell wall-anchored protein
MHSGAASTIWDNAFGNCTSLASVTLSNKLTSIGDSAFIGCTSLASINIPGSVQTIGIQAFAGCPLTSVTLDNGIVTIGQAAFMSTPITQITIPDSVTTIGQAAFAGCTSLKKAVILNSAATFGFGAFGSDTCDIYGFAGSTAYTYATTSGESFPEGSAFPFYTIYKITFDSNGGSDVDWDYAVSDGTINKPGDPTLAGSVFGGWYPTAACDTAAVTFPYTVKGAATLYAKWTELKLASSDADGIIYTGGRVTLTPSVDGGTWDFDSAYLSRNDNTFTALKAGTSTITYTAGGVSTTYAVTIRQSELPSTGQDMTWVWVMGGAALLVCAAGVLARKRLSARVK